MLRSSRLSFVNLLTPSRFLSGLLAALALGGCASSGNIHRIENAPILPQEMGKDIARFEVREEGSSLDTKSDKASAAVPAPAVVPSVAKRPSRKKSATTPKPFEYPKRRPEVDPIWVGERAVYDINYLGVNAGEFSLKLLPFKEINGRKVYHVFGQARSSKVFSMFYKLNDTIETFIDYETIAPHRFHIVLEESKQTRNSLELYDSEKGQTFFWNRWNHHVKGYTEIKDYFPMLPFSQDSLSSLYYLRTVPLPDGAVVRFPVVSEGKNWEAEVTVLRRETLNTPVGRVRTVVLKPETKYQGILKKQGDSFLWMTDDERRLLVRLEAKVRIGTVVAVMTRFEPGVREAPSDTSWRQEVRDELLPTAVSASKVSSGKTLR